MRVREQFEDAPEETLDEVLRVFALLQRAAIPGIIELAPAYTSVAVFFDPVSVFKSNSSADEAFAEFATRIRNAIVPASRRHARRPAASGPRLIEIPVCYDAEFGFDLARVAEHTKLSEREIVDLHSTAEYRVACIGFVPGFTFLTGLPKEFGDAASRRAPQRNSSRFGRHRRCANGNLSVAFSRRLESDRPHSAQAFRSEQRIRPRCYVLAIACVFAQLRGRNLSLRKRRQKITRDPSLRSG